MNVDLVGVALYELLPFTSCDHFLYQSQFHDWYSTLVLTQSQHFLILLIMSCTLTHMQSAISIAKSKLVFTIIITSLIH